MTLQCQTVRALMDYILYLVVYYCFAAHIMGETPSYLTLPIDGIINARLRVWFMWSAFLLNRIHLRISYIIFTLAVHLIQTNISRGLQKVLGLVGTILE